MSYRNAQMEKFKLRQTHSKVVDFGQETPFPVPEKFWR